MSDGAVTSRAAGALRFAAFAGLLLLGALAWARQLAPTDTTGGLLAALIGVGAALALLGARRLQGRRRTAATAVVLLAGLVCALLAAGIEPRLLGWRNWDVLADTIGGGLRTLPSLNVPYRGLDEAVRIVLMCGAGVLALLAAVTTYGQRPDERGAPWAGAVVLALLYGVPVVERNPEHPLLSGAAFTLLLAAFLGAGRLRGRSAVATGAAVALGSVLAGLVLAPALNADEPWLDYQGLAGGLSANRAETFNWDHGYGPLTWPRDGRELLRVKARRPAYWKTTNLDGFDGLRWRYEEPRNPVLADTAIDDAQTDWRERVQFTLRDLRTQQLPGAGTTLSVSDVPTGTEQAGGGTYRTTTRPLRAGDTFTADVYVPDPETADLGRPRAQSSFPFDETRYLSIDLPSQVGGPAGYDPAGPPATVSFSRYRDGAEPTLRLGRGFFAEERGAAAEQAIDASAYGRTYRLAQQLRQSSSDPYDFLRRVGRRVRAGATYTETPPEAAVPLDSFLFDTRQGYCQQFSGAMALLLRMGGVPARVASGFSPGTFDADRGEYVVRDLDAHSWVEAYFPGVGWVTFDPTPSEAPAALQEAGDDFDDAAAASDEGSDSAAASAQRGADGASVGSGDAADASGGGGGGVGWELPALALVLLGSAGVALAYAVRRPAGTPQEPWQLVELRRALARTGRPVASSLTLTALERRFAEAPAAQAYVRSLRDARYSGRPAPSGREAERGRVALRRELGHGLGPLGRLKALLALPPRRA